MQSQNATYPPIFPLLSFDSYEFARLIFFVPLKFLFFAFGFFTNIFNASVFWEIGLSNPSILCLFSLSLSDLLRNCLMFLRDLAAPPLRVGSDLFMPFVDITYVMNPLSLACSVFGSWVKIVVIIGTCWTVFSPEKAKKLFTRMVVTVLLVVMALVQVVHISLQLLAMKITVFTSPFTNQTSARYDWFNRNKNLAKLSAVAFYYAPIVLFFLVILFVMVYVSFAVRRYGLFKEVGSTSERVSKGNGTFRSVLAVGMIHFICSIPVVAIFLTASVYTKFDVFDPYLGWLTSLMLEIDYLTQAVSQAVNFFVYYNLMAKFKQIFKKHFCCKTGGRE